MSRELICPKCGAFLPLDDPELHDSGGSFVADPGRTIESVIPATMSLADHPLGESLGPESTLATPAIEPGIGSFVAGDSVAVLEPWSAHQPHPPSLNGSSETDKSIPSFSNPVAPAFPGLDAEPPRPTGPPTPPEPAVSIGEEETSGPGLVFVLLASYASAVTLACGWLLWQARQRDAANAPDTLPVDSRPDDRSAMLTPIPKNRTTTLGKTVRIGDLELTPIRATLGSVALQSVRPNGDREQKQGAYGSILVSLSLKNLSKTGTFAPIEQAFVRIPDRGASESFFETSEGTIGLFPLAVASEWSIVGQNSRDLKPGESMETVIASEPTPTRTLAGTLRLRLKLRSGANTVSEVHIDLDGDTLR